MEETDFVVSNIIYDFVRPNSINHLLNDINKELVRNNISSDETISQTEFSYNIEICKDLGYIVCQISKRKIGTEYVLSLWFTLPDKITFRYLMNWKTDKEDIDTNFVLDCDKTSPIFPEINDLYE